MPSRVEYVENGPANSGVGVRAELIRQGVAGSRGTDLTRWQLDGEQGQLLRDGKVVASTPPWPGALGSKSVQWMRLGNVMARELHGYEAAPHVYHFTNQTLSFLAKRLKPAVVTVHDIIEAIEPQSWQARYLSRYLYSGITVADRLIAVSEYTKKTVQDHFGVPADKITVIPNAADEGVWHAIENFEQSVGYHELRRELKMAEATPVLLYVGSDHPRKNVTGAVQVLARVKQKLPEVVLVKVGEPGLPAGREALLSEIDRLGIRDDVRFVGSVPRERLNELYNLARVLLYPSRFEGFGFPPLQAMAAGTPVVTSNATSLPEVVGDDGAFGERAAAVFDPDDIDGMAERTAELMSDRQSREQLIEKGFRRVGRFSWEQSARAVQRIYADVAQGHD